MKRKKYIFSAHTKDLFFTFLFFMLLVGLCGVILPFAFNDYSIFGLLLVEPILALFIPLIFFERFAIADEEKIVLYKYNKKQQTVLWEQVSTIVVKKPKIFNPKGGNKLKNLGFLLITDTNGNFIRLSHNQRTENLIRLYFKGDIIQQRVWFQDIKSVFPPQEESNI